MTEIHIPWIRLTNKDTGEYHMVNTYQIDSFSDYEIWIRGKRFKVEESMYEINQLLVA